MFKLVRKIGLLGAFLVAGFGLSGTASAIPITIGDVLASIGNGKVNVYTQDGTLKQTLDTGLGGFTTGGTFDSAGNFYVTAFSSNRVSKFDSNGNLVDALWATGNSRNESIVFDGSGNAYIGNAGAFKIKKVDSTGAQIVDFTTQLGTDWIDLKADQKTLLYSNEGSTIRELNTETLVDTVFTSDSSYGTLYAKRYLSDGGVIAASGTGNVFRWNASGVLQHTYSIGIGSVFALNLDSNGTSFWTGTTGGTAIRKINIATGVIEQSWNTTGQLFGLTVAGEIQAGGGGFDGGNSVPEPGTTGLLLLGLAGLSMARRRRA